MTIFNKLSPLVIFAATGLLLGSQWTFAEEKSHYYLQLQLQNSDVNDDERWDTSGTGSNRETNQIDGGDGYSAIVGFQTENFRFELQYLSLDSMLEDIAATRAGGDSLDVSGPFLNFWYLTPKLFDERLQPYFGGGLGRLRLETDQLDEDKNAIMIGAGFDVAIVDALEIGLGLRYLPSGRYSHLDPGQASSPILGGNNGDNFVIKYEAIITQIGIKFNF